MIKKTPLCLLYRRTETAAFLYLSERVKEF